jgi:Cu2+-exporting ATPase
VPESRLDPAAKEQFCCSGCEAVWRILHEYSLDEYYRLREQFPEGRRIPAQVSGRSFDYLDDPEFQKRFGESRTEGGLRIEFFLEGVHCVACSWLVEKVLLEKAGARYAHLNIGKSVVEVVFNPHEVRLSDLARALDHIGYTPHPVFQDSDSSARRREARRLLARMGIAAACAANIMLLAISQYAGDVTGIEASYSALFRWISLGLALPAVTYSAWPFYRGAWSGLRNRMLHMDLPISLGILAAFAVSVSATVRSRGDVYFDSVTILIFLLLAGRLVLQRAGGWAAGASESLLALTPKTARRIDEDGVHEVLLTEIRVGDTLRVLPGEIVPADGVLISNPAQIREAHLTGEPDTIIRQAGEVVYAGSTVEQSPLDVQTTAVGETTRLWGLAQLMREASARRAPIVLLMDRIAGYFVATVLALAAGTAIIWFFVEPSRALWNAAALMVVTCPCALGLATPTALAMAMGRAARRWLYVRGQDGVERISRVSHLIFDKTGTLTSGRLSVVQATYAPELATEEARSIISSVAALEQLSGHAISTAFSEISTAGQHVEQVRVSAGAGVRGMANGRLFSVGTRSFVSEFVTEIPSLFADAERDAEVSALTVVYVARERSVVALYALGDSVRPEAVNTVHSLRQSNLTMELLSGDQPQAVGQVARLLDIRDFRGRVSPEEKLERVEELENQGIRTAMIGDGVNDAAALSRATIGISAAGAAEVARAAADVFVSTSRGPDAIAELFRISSRAMRKIRVNLWIALGYNLAGATLAMTGLISPLLAAVLMPASSLTVLFIATRR